MPSKTYAEVLSEAKRLPPDDQRRLVEELTRSADKSSDTEASGDNDKVRTLYDALQARGLIGCLTDAPPDLSTNPKYMEGFGRDAG